MKKKIYVIMKVGMGRILLSFIGIFLCGYIFYISFVEITPSSVHVSGYTRSDGTVVNSYNRRPPNSVLHDIPFQTLSIISGIGTIACGIYFIKLIILCKNKEAIDYFIEEIKWNEDYPQKNYKEIKIPNMSTIPRKDWRCNKCNGNIYSGTKYFYYKNEGTSFRSHYCEKCIEILKEEKKENDKKKKIYTKKYNEIRAKHIEQLTIEYKKKFGNELYELEKYVL
jgi:hypothetical protein